MPFTVGPERYFRDHMRAAHETSVRRMKNMGCKLYCFTKNTITRERQFRALFLPQESNRQNIRDLFVYFCTVCSFEKQDFLENVSPDVMHCG